MRQQQSKLSVILFQLSTMNYDQIVSDFYRHLTLDIGLYLQTIQGVVDLKFNENNGCETVALLHWEQLHSVQLPQEIKCFYLATNGFQLTWKFKLADVNYPIGNMHINSLTQLCPVTEPWKSDQPADLETNKLFILDSNFSQGSTVLLVTKVESVSCSVHYLSGKGHLFKLADDLQTYLRLMMLYLGLPDWPLLHLKIETSYWVKQIYHHFVPHLMEPASPVATYKNPEINIDCNVFKNSTKNSKLQR